MHLTKAPHTHHTAPWVAKAPATEARALKIASGPLSRALKWESYDMNSNAAARPTLCIRIRMRRTVCPGNQEPSHKQARCHRQWETRNNSGKPQKAHSKRERGTASAYQQQRTHKQGLKLPATARRTQRAPGRRKQSITQHPTSLGGTVSPTTGSENGVQGCPRSHTGCERRNRSSLVGATQCMHAVHALHRLCLHSCVLVI